MPVHRGGGAQSRLGACIYVIAVFPEPISVLWREFVFLNVFASNHLKMLLADTVRMIYVHTVTCVYLDDSCCDCMHLVYRPGCSLSLTIHKELM